MHIQTYPQQKEKTTSPGIEHPTNNERYMDFLIFALSRIIETALFYETQAKRCTDSVNKLFLYYLAGKKRVQHVVLEMIATSNRGRPLALSNYNCLKSLPEISHGETFSTASAKSILDFAHKHAQKDLNLFMSLAALEEDTYTKKLLSTLSKLAKDFILDISAGYSKFILKNKVSSDATLS